MTRLRPAARHSSGENGRTVAIALKHCSLRRRSFVENVSKLRHLALKLPASSEPGNLHCTVTVTVVECARVPEVAVTVML
jgi:hypothetical protein